MDCHRRCPDYPCTRRRHCPLPPSQGILRRYHYGFRVVQATSADTEWLPKLYARYILRGWSRQAYFVADATASMHCAFTPPPPPHLHTHQPPLPPGNGCLRGLPRILATGRAQHGPQALCSGALARGPRPRIHRRRQCSAAHCTPPPSSTQEGRLLFNARLGVMSLHDDSLIRRAAIAPSWGTARWSAGGFASLLLDSSLPRAPVVMALRLRAILYPPPPLVTVNYYTCDFCDAPVDPP